MNAQKKMTHFTVKCKIQNRISFLLLSQDLSENRRRDSRKVKKQTFDKFESKLVFFSTQKWLARHGASILGN